MEACQNKPLDDHSFWEGDDEIAGQQDVWLQRMVNATDIISSMGGKDRGTMPLAAERIIDALKNPILDWRTILNDFVQEEICDYSFAPPDRRMEDSPFFLPDFNEKDEKAKDILFMIDTSGSMSDDQITQCYSEIYGAIGQFNGKLQGKLGFFDATVVEPTPFEDEDEFEDEGFEYGDEETTIYEVKCACGNVIAFDEDTLEEGSIICDECGETLEFTFDDVDEDEE